MKVLAVNSAKSIWLVKSIFLNPQGNNLTLGLAALAERYQFVKVPPPAAVLNRPLDLKLEGGSFARLDGTPIFVNASIYDDGVIAETRTSTDESDRFLNDALSWFSATFKLPHPSELEIQRIYASELIVELDLPPTIFNPRFAAFVQRMKQGVSNNPGVSMEFSGLHFAPDPEAAKRLVAFRVERLAGVPFSARQYYSAAPVGTAEHLELLKALEEAAS